MGEPITNPAIKVADDIQSILYDVVLVGVEAAAKAEVPFLALPVISQVFDFFVGQIGSLIYKQLELYVAFEIIDLQVAHEASNYKNAVDDLHKAHESGDTDAINKARANFKSTLGNLIHYDGQ